jgi:hypothetical protein
MTLADFEATVASYMNRPLASWTVGGLDLILQALNDCRRAAQRDYAFEMFERTAFVQLSTTPANIMTDFKADPSGAGATVQIRIIRGVWEYVMNGVLPSRTRQLDLRSLSTWRQELPLHARRWNDVTVTPSSQLSSRLQDFAYIQGMNIYHCNLPTPKWHMADVVAWQPDLTVGDDPDIFLTYFSDWLKWATIAQLNGYLKEDQRVQISMTAMAAAWENVKQFDSQITASSNALDGD